MLRGNDHIGRTEKGIGTGGVDGDIVAHIGLKGDLRTGRATDPVLLLDLHALDEIQIVQVINETVGILGNAEHPLALFLADHLAAAALAHALHHFLVGQDALAAGAPVHRHGGLVGQAVLEHLQEDPLGPLIILGVGGVYTAVPIEAVSQHFKLAGKVLDVFLGDHSGMDMVFDGEVLRGQAKGVKANGEQNIVALHALFTGNHVDGGKGPGMAHMESRCGGIRKLDKAVKLFTGLVAGNGAIGLGFFPIVLPFFLNGRKIVLHTVSPLSEYLFAHNKAKRPGPHKSVRGVRKRYTTLIRLRIAPPPSAAPSARSILCNGRARPALPPSRDSGRQLRGQCGKAPPSAHTGRRLSLGGTIPAFSPSLSFAGYCKTYRHFRIILGICQEFVFWGKSITETERQGRESRIAAAGLNAGCAMTQRKIRCIAGCWLQDSSGRYTGAIHPREKPRGARRQACFSGFIIPAYSWDKPRRSGCVKSL